MTDQEIREQFDMLQARSKLLSQNIKKLHETVTKTSVTVDELAAVAEAHNEALRADGEHIRALARIAEIHDRRLTRLVSCPS